MGRKVINTPLPKLLITSQKRPFHRAKSIPAKFDGHPPPHHPVPKSRAPPTDGCNSNLKLYNYNLKLYNFKLELYNFNLKFKPGVGGDGIVGCKPGQPSVPHKSGMACFHFRQKSKRSQQ